MHLSEERAYRKNLATVGLLYIGGIEVQIHVQNLSLSGLLAEFPLNAQFHSYRDIFQALLVSPIVDLYLPEMRVAGEAEVVRVDDRQGHAEVALEFRALSYNTDNMLYNRKAYRKSMTAPGRLRIRDFSTTFMTVNVSVDGLMIRLDGHLEPEVGMIARFDFDHLDIAGDAKVIWVDHDETTTLIWLQYVRLEKGPVKGIPRFERRHFDRRSRSGDEA